MPTRCSSSSPACPSTAATSASTAFPRSGRSSSSRCSSRTGRSGARCSGRSTAASWPSRTGSGCATRAPRRSPSPSATTFQRRGIGTRLLEQLAARAAQAGIEEFVAEVLHDNATMLGVFRDAGFAVTRAGEGGELEIRFAIAPTDTYREHVAERDHVAVRASLEPFFQPRSVAVVGASKRRGSIGGELFRNILTGDFAGSVYPVNRKGDSVAGVHGYGAVGEIAEAVDLAVICLPGELVLDAAEEALAAGVRALVVISAGFAETGSEGSRAAGAAARARPRARRASPRPELPRHRLDGRSPQRDLRAAQLPARQDRLLLAERRARARAARAGGGDRPRSHLLRVRRQQGGRLLERPARVVGGRRRDRDGRPLPRVVRQPARVLAHRAAACAPQADPRAEGRQHAGGQPRRRFAHGRARRLGRRGRRALPPRRA